MIKKNIKKTSSWIYTNKKALNDYFLFKSFEAGLALKGNEVKKILQRKFNSQNVFVFIDQKCEAFLLNLKTSSSLKKPRKIKLLLHKKQILYLKNKQDKENLVIILKKMYLLNNKIKALIFLAQAKKKYQKKERLISKTLKREHQHQKLKL